MGEGLVAFWLVAVIFGIILMVCWIVLPFAVLGIKPLMKEQIAASKRTNALLEQLINDSRASPTKSVATWKAER